VKHFRPFARTQHSFEERAFPVPSLTAIGKIVLNFADLREEVTRCLWVNMDLCRAQGQMVFATMGFREQVNLLAAQLHEHANAGECKPCGYDAHEIIAELASQCLMAERLRDQIMESSWYGSYDKLVRTRPRVHPASGLRLASEEMDAAHLMDIADFISMVTLELETYFGPQE
jgi:hypothetical protein